MSEKTPKSTRIAEQKYSQPAGFIRATGYMPEKNCLDSLQELRQFDLQLSRDTNSDEGPLEKQ